MWNIYVVSHGSARTKIRRGDKCVHFT